MHDLPLDRDPIDALAEEFVSRYRRGENPSVEDYAQRYPELAADVRELFPAATLLEDLKGPPGSSARAVAVPEQLGDYRIIREIGRGGMGVVYEAEQGSLGRKVALKVLPAYARMAAEQLERFRREARAAGRLHHTNIVPVFGVGEHDGMPYYVMQLIAGQGLERVLTRLRAAQARTTSPRSDSTHVPPGRGEVADPTTPGDLTPPPLPVEPTEVWGERGPTWVGIAPHAGESGSSVVPPFNTAAYYRFVARLGAQVADALDHAHRQGILHRDVKPANLLLDQSGTVWVTDFGLAKLLEHDDLTLPGEVAGTLRYSAPERFAGRSDTRTDVYSLGLTLYELLTLRPAYAEPDPSRLLLQVTEGRIVSPRAVNPAVPRDLETVVLRCLNFEPERRYARAGELADDLRRFLDDRPVKARRTTVLEHGWRWCRRNPAVALLSASLLLVFLIGFGGVAWKWREASANLRLAKEREQEALAAVDRADDERRRAKDNLDLAMEAFDKIARQLASGRPGVPLDSGEETPTVPVVTPEVAAVLQDLVSFQERFAATNSNDPRLKRDTARALRQVGTIRLRLGEYAQAITALTRAAELLSDSPDQKLELAQTYNDLGVVLRAAGKYPEALRSHGQAQEILDGWPDPAPPRVRLELARTLTLTGPMEMRQGGTGDSQERRQAALARAEHTQRRGLEIFDKLVEEDKHNPEYRHLLSRATYDLAMMLWHPTRRAEGTTARARALEMQEKLAADFPAVPDYRAELAEMLLSSFGRSSQLKAPKEAEERFARAVALADDLVAKNPAVPDYQALQARAKARLGGAQALLDDKSDDAVLNLRKAIKLTDLLTARLPNTPGYRFSGLEARLVLGELERKRGELDASAKYLGESVDELKKVLVTSPRNRFMRSMLGRHARSLAQTLKEQGKTDEADEMNKLADEMTPPKP